MVFNANKAREIFEKSGRKTAWVAEKLGVKTAYVQKILNGSSKPSMPVIKLLAITLECREEDLLLPQEVAS